MFMKTYYKQLVEKMNSLISPFISVHSETCNTQHVLIEKWKRNLGNALLGLGNFRMPLIVFL